MKNNHARISLQIIALSHFILACSISASAQGDKAEILALMHKVNDWQVAHPVMKPLDRNWERGTWYTGVMAAWKATGDKRFLDQSLKWGQQHTWQVGTERNGANCLFCVQTWLETYFVKPDPAMTSPTVHWLATAAPFAPSNAEKWNVAGDKRIYSDSLYGAPALAMLTRATGDPQYLKIMHEFFWRVTDKLLDKEEGLYYRDMGFIGKRTTNGGKILWSRGNGWVFGGIVRILEYLPQDDPQRPRYVKLLQTMAAALANRQGADGLWRPNLGDAAELPMPETSGTGFFCYGLAWGINHGILDREAYLPVIQKAWKGLCSAVSPEGKVLWGQQVDAMPHAVKQESTHEYVTGTFLLAASEVYRLAGGAPEAKAITDTATQATLLPPVARTDRDLSPGAHPLAEKINLFIERQKNVKDFKPTGLTRNDYLKVIDGQVRSMRAYQNAAGRIIDPVGKAEVYYPTPCYAHAVAALATSGFETDPEVLESGMKAMDVSVADMARGNAPPPKNDTGDFFIYPLMMAYNLYAKTVPPARLARWREDLRRMNPRKVYHAYGGKGNKWCVVNLSGDYLRAAAGLTTMDYMETSLAAQFPNFTEMGMYNEGGNPLPYDHFSRHYLGGMMFQGYRGKSFELCRDLVWRGAWTSLFMLSPTGQAPTGYRSSHHIWNEAESAVTFEIYASQYARSGRMVEAGAFKRAAHLSLQCFTEWLRPDGSGYIVKNRYPIEAPHGYELYSYHTCYNMLACSMLAQAWQFADESVAEQPAPCDVGGYVVPILTPFHKIFASAGGTYAEYDTSGDHKYNPTGLLRVHVKGGHPQLGPSDGCAPLFSGKGESLAVGPSWRDATGAWHSLAEMSPKNPKLEILEETPSRTTLRVTFADLKATSQTGRGISLAETITVESAGVTVRDELRGGSIKSFRVNYPMLVFDGLKKTNITLNRNTLGMSMDGKGVKLQVDEPAGVELVRSGREVGHRNGMVEPVYADIPGQAAVYRIQTWRE